MEIKEIEKNEKKTSTYVCRECDFVCSYYCDWARHLSTRKHIRNHKINEMEIKKNEENEKNEKNEKKKKQEKNICIFSCETCFKLYYSLGGLWKHKRKCTANKNNQIVSNDPETLSDKELILMLMKDNKELRETIIEQSKESSEYKNMMMEVIKNGTNNVTHTNSHNKTFNLNVFLNEQCKDAVNMSDFLSSIRVELTDLENVGRTNYVEGISNLLLKNLRTLNTYMRPIHCSDFKRETLYIKDNNKWEKETDDRNKIKNIIKIVANENIKKIGDWAKKYPDCKDPESRKNDLYLNIISNSMSGGSEEEARKNLDGIIRNIAREVTIQK